MSECDYEFFVEREDGASSETRLFRTGKVHGDIVNYLHPDGRIYDFLRYATRKCLLLSVFPDEPERKPEYSRLVDVDITASKFDILYDEKSKYYYMIASRTAYGNPHNFHDANYQTFHKIKNFRKLSEVPNE